MIRRPPRSTLSSSSAASDVYKRQVHLQRNALHHAGQQRSGRGQAPAPRSAGQRQRALEALPAHGRYELREVARRESNDRSDYELSWAETEEPRCGLSLATDRETRELRAVAGRRRIGHRDVLTVRGADRSREREPRRGVGAWLLRAGARRPQGGEDPGVSETRAVLHFDGELREAVIGGRRRWRGHLQ